MNICSSTFVPNCVLTMAQSSLYYNYMITLIFHDAWIVNIDVCICVLQDDWAKEAVRGFTNEVMVSFHYNLHTLDATEQVSRGRLKYSPHIITLPICV